MVPRIFPEKSQLFSTHSVWRRRLTMTRCRRSERIRADDDQFYDENPLLLDASVDMMVNEAKDYAALKTIVRNWGTETLF